uniref:E2 ubiquitin-conjugating enzyme n=1 Tax=Davidia involucrata TaxID=16924 RepID=A0A5B6ZNH2_DAVIN
MESPPVARYIPQKSKKRVFPGSSSSYMDPEVVEISLPASWSSKSKSLKQKEVMHHEVIDVDMDEDSTDVMLIDEKVDTKNKGKETLANSNGHSSAAKRGSVDGFQSSKRSSAPGSHNSINLDGFSSDLSYGDDEYMDMYYDDLMYDDQYAVLQAHFDNIDIPPGVEVPIPWLSDPAQSKEAATASSTHSSLGIQSDAMGFPPGTDWSSSWCLPKPAQIRKKSSSTSSPSLQTQMDAVCHSHGEELSLSWSLPEPAQSKKKLAASTYSSLQTQKSTLNLLPGVEPLKPRCFPESSINKKNPGLSGSTTRYSSCKQFGTMKLSPGIEPSSEGSYFPKCLKKQVGNGSLTYSSFISMDTYSSFLSIDTTNHPPGVDASKSRWQDSPVFPDYSKNFPLSDAVHIFPEEESYVPWVQDLAKSQTNANAAGSSTIPIESASSRENYGNENDILEKFHLFKQFDTVQDHSDHHYSRSGSSMKQPSKNWAKKIQDEWRILEKDLPDTIFVRVYESRMDLMRAVIVGAEGTPYHDGLFFFDVFFPCNYPNIPPHVYYHSGGLRINPNLYNCGKVCLSLLNTWSGNQNEKWIPGVSTMLQVLVSIQGLILNAKPYFNEPGFARMNGSEGGEKNSQQYNENTFILSLKTMVYSMRRPPKHFEDFVVGHFFKRAHDILVACKAYMDGAQVGCLARGGVQDVDEGDKSCSQHFKQTLAGYFNTLVQAFKQIGAKD